MKHITVYLILLLCKVNQFLLALLYNFEHVNKIDLFTTLFILLKTKENETLDY
jgi:hypothetical protein